MLTWFTQRAKRKANAHNLYGSIVALSREPAIYDTLNVPDTTEGRFEILVLHIFVCLERMNGKAAPLAQDIVNLFFADMDTTSRELGVGDMVVPKKMRKLAAIYEDRIMAYKSAVAHTNGNILSNALLETVFGGEEASVSSARALRSYVGQLRQNLSKHPLEDLMAGRIDAPDIAGIS